MGKLAIKSRTSGPTKEELYGRVLEGLADTDVDRFNAYKRAMGADNVKLENYAEQSPAINVQRRGKWVEPDKGIDIYDVTTDMVPELPAIGGAAIGGATAGIQGAVGGATIGNLIKQKIAQKMGLRKGISEGEAKFEGAMELLGPIGAAIPTPNVMARTVFHGSPHVFDKFDMSKIGTGEGAQAYGHGLYFAEAPEVAKSYSGKLSSELTYNGKAMNRNSARNSKDSAAWAVYLAGGDKELAKRSGLALPDAIDGINLDKLKPGGALYTVDIPDEHIDRMLDWDKPLSEQSAEVQKTLTGIAGKYGLQNPVTSGRSLAAFIYDLGHPKITGSPLAASQELKAAGIPGIKYLDGTSRTAGAGTQNFVVFDDNLPKILSRE